MIVIVGLPYICIFENYSQLQYIMILQICNEFVLQFYIENKIVFGKIYG